ncbi:eukaryotic translation initiation factor 5B-like [Saccostrea cucullata]|uniref:eukaryotic translation initiation factor 5B-like n=1 Tax=Saccostrea cuccullata TaxID=36930 RepID=UPI002ED1FD32
MGEEISLTASSLQTKLTDSLYLYQKNRILCDCCIQCIDGEVYAHKIILAMWGMYGFYIDTIDTIKALTFSTADVNNFMKFIYSGNISLTSNAASRVVQFGKHIGINLRCITNCHTPDSIQSALSTLKSFSRVGFQYDREKKSIYMKSLPDFQSIFTSTTNVRCREPIKKTNSISVKSRESKKRAKSMTGSSEEPSKKAKSVPNNSKGPVKTAKSTSGIRRKPTKRAKTKHGNRRKPAQGTKSVSGIGKEPINRAKSVSENSSETTKKAKSVSSDNEESTKRAKSVSNNNEEQTKRAKSESSSNDELIKRAKSVSSDNEESTKRAKSVSSSNDELTKRAKSESSSNDELTKRAKSVSSSNEELSLTKRAKLKPIKRTKTMITEKRAKNLKENSLCQSSGVSSTVLFDENKSAVFPVYTTGYSDELGKTNTSRSYAETRPEIVIEVKTENCKNFVLKTEERENED